MPAVLAQPTLGSVDRRERALRAHLDRLRQAGQRETDVVAIETQSGPLRLSSWVRAQLGPFFASGAEGAGDEVAALAHGVALMAKCMDDQGRYARTDELAVRQRFALQAELMLDTALGMAILRETHQAIDRAVARGRTDHARRLSTFHHRLRSAVREVRRNIAASELQHADLLADNLTDEPRTEPVKTAPVLVPRDVQPAVRRRATWRKIVSLRSRTGEDASWFPGRTELLVVALALSLAVLVAVRLPAALAPEVVPISIADFADVPAILAVKARPASLYVTVDAEAWGATDSPARRDLVGSVAGLASRRGYEGALISTSEGRSVGRWLANRGPALVDWPEPAERPADAQHTRFRFR